VSHDQKQIDEMIECLEIYWKRGCQCATERSPDKDQTAQLCDVCARAAEILEREGKFD